MKLEKVIPVCYLHSLRHNRLLIHVRLGPTISSFGYVWMRHLQEADYELCEIGENGESVEDVVMPAGGDNIFCKLAIREGKFLTATSIANYNLGTRRVSSRILESDFGRLLPDFKRFNVYSLVDGSSNENSVKCVVNVGQEDGFTESWLVDAGFEKCESKLNVRLAGLFW